MRVIDLIDMLNNDMTPPQTIVFYNNVLFYDREDRTYKNYDGDKDIMDIIGRSYWSLEQLYNDDIKVQTEDEINSEYYKKVKKEIIEYGISCEGSDKKEIINDILNILTKEYFK